ncbi:uncharacterized protein LOC105214750 [Zeugodacus cucurbitae]|uniref:Uncharacterized protein C3orf19 n=1 Tax=Zeugodacus cucurbitae TaxID=28588 RepID=A0A0A1WK74_ZEUCU|nr:uncharacterized protein LOC105214750 [Zeugodacus cucurbitae]
MSYYFQTTIIYCIFIFLMCLHGGRSQYNIHRRDLVPKVDVSDPTKGLTDAEIDMALDDLSLSDLNVLNKLIDRPNAPDYDYVDYDSHNYALGPPRDHTFDGNPMDDDSNINYYDDIDEPQRDARNPLHFKIPRKSLMPFMEQTENQRTKRDNGREIKQAAVDAEYIRQLENSFPRDQEQNNNEESEDKKEHIRVKRN